MPSLGAGLIPIVLLTAWSASAQRHTPPARAGASSHGLLFISPMGEPFRNGGKAIDLVGQWFRAVDSNSDRSLDLTEMQADASRFFNLLDVDRDGEIGPAEMRRYERDLVPEIGLGTQFTGSPTRSHSNGRGGMDHSGKGERSHGSERSHGDQQRLARRGAGLFAFLGYPQPVIAADADMNRGVSRGEFAKAAVQRFRLLDGNRDGKLVRSELPRVPTPRAKGRRH